MSSDRLLAINPLGEKISNNFQSGKQPLFGVAFPFISLNLQAFHKPRIPLGKGTVKFVDFRYLLREEFTNLQLDSNFMETIWNTESLEHPD